MNKKQIAFKMRNILKKHMYRNNNQISYAEARDIMSKNPLTILIDVRSKQEYKEYHLDGAICIPTYEIVSRISQIIKDKEQIIIVYCQSGVRSKKAAIVLRKMGYENIYEIKGGLDNL
jgi:rhodanese-related sulfurtransferase